MTARSGLGTLRDALVRAARARALVAYSEVDHLVGLAVSRNPHHRQALGGLLVTIGAAELDGGRPFLPAVVVRKADRRPGAGFYAAARLLQPRHAALVPRDGLHDTVLAEVYAFWAGGRRDPLAGQASAAPFLDPDPACVCFPPLSKRC